MKNIARIATATLAGLFVAGHQTQATEAQIAVRFAAQELTTTSGTAAVYSRIVRAANNVCGERIPTGTLLPSRAWQRCVDQAVERAVAAVASRPLYAYHAKQTQRRAAHST